MADKEFDSDNFIRTGGGVSFEERAPQPSDFTAARGYTYAYDFMYRPTEFSKGYTQWQAFADCFVMRRPVTRIGGTQTCSTESSRANDLAGYTDPDFVRVKNFKIKGSSRSTIPNGKYQMVNFNFSDDRTGFTVVTVEYQQYGEWELVKLVSNPPSPGSITG